MVIRILSVILLICWILIQYILWLSGTVDKDIVVRYLSIAITLILGVITAHILLCG